MTGKARALTMASIAKLAPTKDNGRQRKAQLRIRTQLKAGYPGMTPEQLQAAGEREETKAKRTRDKAKREVDRVAYLLANPKP